MATYDTPIPGVAAYSQTALLAKKAYQEALARINQQRSGTLRTHGYRGDIDPETGVLSNVSVDPNNPYGALQETLGMNADEAQAGEDEMTARGISGGLARQQESRLQHGFGRRKAQLGTGLLSLLGGLQDNQNQAKYAHDSALYEAELEAARNAISNNEFNPAAVTGESPGYGDDPENPGTPGREIPAGRPGHGNPPKVNWGGSYKTRDQLIRLLISRGVKPSTWAQNHPADAKRLGISPKNNANNALIKKARR
jgi:hypothetical protein